MTLTRSCTSMVRASDVRRRTSCAAPEWVTSPTTAGRLRAGAASESHREDGREYTCRRSVAPVTGAIRAHVGRGCGFLRPGSLKQTPSKS